MGVKAIAVYAEADRHSQHVRQADEAWSLGDGPVRDTYLNQDKLLHIAAQCGAQAIHPGYGFLSENAGFVTRCEQAGLVFLGPTVAQMTAFGLKHQARALAQQNDVPPAARQWLAHLAGQRLRTGTTHRLSGDVKEHRGRRRHRHAALQ
ncbi:hypothetical protein OS12_12240 [Dickeya oryzae]